MKVSLEDFHKQVASFEAAVSKSQLSDDQRYDLLKEFDPYFSDIPPALLNAGHLATYAVATGMIEPFDRSKLTKPATYLVSAEGPVRYRNEQGHVERFYLTKDMKKRETESCVRDYVRLAPNSVCFLTLEPTFRMPSYIAARFNLMIKDVYRGLLVGTGPLVDPGFQGKISIPIHNFTSQEYYISAGDGLVYFEFTKMSWKNPETKKAQFSWLPQSIDHQPPFPASKNSRHSLDDYLAQATGGGPPQHAIQTAVSEMRTQADRARNLLTVYTLGGIAAAVGLVLTGWSLYNGAQQFTTSAQTELRESRYQLSKDMQDLKALVESYKK